MEAPAPTPPSPNCTPTCFWTSVCAPPPKNLLVDADGKPSADAKLRAQQQFTRGTALHAKEQLHEAVAAYRAAAALDPTRIDVLYNLANALQDVGTLAEAKDYYGRVIARSPDHYAAHYNLGYVLEELGDAEAALGEFREAARLDPADKDAVVNVGNVLMQLGEAEAAVAEYQSCVGVSRTERFDARREATFVSCDFERDWSR